MSIIKLFFSFIPLSTVIRLSAVIRLSVYSPKPWRRRAVIPLSAVILLSAVFQPAQSQNSQRNQKNAFDALNFWSKARAYPETDISSDKYSNAFYQVNSTLKESENSVQSTSPWEFIGPSNVFGRMLCVAVNPKNSGTIYAGSAGSGLWRSHTGGRGGDWHRVPTGFPVIGVSTIAIDSSDSNIIYIGTGEVYLYRGALSNSAGLVTRGSYGIGILKTTNGGATWTKSLDWSTNQERGVQVIRINPLNSNTILAGTTEGIYRSTNAGATWEQTFDVIMVEDIIINREDTTLVMASCGNFQTPGWGVYLSLEGGTNWFRMDGFPSYTGKTMLGAYKQDPNIIFASVADDTSGEGGLWKTTNFGVTWDSIHTDDVFGFLGWYSHFVAVNPANESNVLHGAVEIYGTPDGGNTIYMGGGAHDNYHGYAHDPSDSEVLYVATDGGIFVTYDFGYTFESANAGLQTTQFFPGFSNSASDPNFAIGQIDGNAAWKYTGTTAWEPGGGIDVGWTAIDQTNDNFVYVGTQWGLTIHKSNNRAVSYNTMSNFFDMEFSCWIAPFVISPSNSNVMYFGKDRIRRSLDASATWNTVSGVLDGNPTLAMAISATNPDILYLSTAPFMTTPHIYRTTNGGGAWQNVTGTLPNRYPLDIAVDPNNSSVVYVSFGGFGTGHIFKSADAGANWNDITETLPDVPTSAVVVDPLNSNYIYIGNDIGVFVSTNGGAAWASFNDGLPEGLIVSDLVVSPSNRKLRVATYGNGVFQRDLLSPVNTTVAVELKDNWNLISVPVDMPDNSISAAYPSAINGTIYEYDGQYKAATKLLPGKAYWAKFPAGTTTQSITGPSLPVITITLKKGWNLVGSVDHDIPAPTGGIIASSWFEFTASGYQIATTLKPGRGYWLKAAEDGSIPLGTNE